MGTFNPEQNYKLELRMTTPTGEIFQIKELLSTDFLDWDKFANLMKPYLQAVICGKTY